MALSGVPPVFHNHFNSKLPRRLSSLMGYPPHSTKSSKVTQNVFLDIIIVGLHERCLKKNLNASRPPPEHPPVRGGGKVKTFSGWDHRLLVFYALVRAFPDNVFFLHHTT